MLFFAKLNPRVVNHPRISEIKDSKCPRDKSREQRNPELVANAEEPTVAAPDAVPHAQAQNPPETAPAEASHPTAAAENTGRTESDDRELPL